MIFIKTGSFRLYLRLKSKKQSAILCGAKDCGLLLSTGLFERLLKSRMNLLFVAISLVTNSYKKEKILESKFHYATEQFWFPV